MPLELTQHQQRIFEGLKRIGGEISNLYLDGIRILESDLFISKSYLLGHIAREIDGGLRDILASENKMEIIGTNVPSIEKNKHINSILLSLGLSDKSDFASNWHSISSQFNIYAHRHGAYKESRDPSSIIQLWGKYEQVLYKLVGSFYSITDRIDRILRFEEPSNNVINTLSNLLKDSTLEAYFYKNLHNPKWFIPLRDKKFFSCSQLKQSVETENGIRYLYWNQLYYFKNILDNTLDDEKPRIQEIYSSLISIIIDISSENWQKDELLNPYIWHDVILLLNKIPIAYHSKFLYDFIPTWFSKKDDNLLSSADLISELLPHVLEDDGPIDLKEYFVWTVLQLIEKKDYSFNNRFEFIFQNHWLGSLEAIESISTRIAENLNIESSSEFFIKSICQINWFQFPHSKIELLNEGFVIELTKSNTKVAISISKINSEFIWEGFISAIENQKFGIDGQKVSNLIITAIKNNKLSLSAEGKEKIINGIEFFCKHDFNNTHFPKLDESIDSYHKDDTNGILIMLLIKTLSKASFLNTQKIQKIIETHLLTERYDIFRRIAFETIAVAYQNLNPCFWKLLNNNESKHLLTSGYLFNEVYKLLNRNCQSFTKRQSHVLRELLINTAEQFEKSSEYWLFKYLSALRKNDVFKNDYDRLSQKLGLTFKDIEESGNVKTHWRKRDTFKVSEFETLSIKEIVDRILSFEDKGGWADPNEESLGIMLQNDCSNQPQKYSQNLDYFLNIPHIYAYYLIRSFEQTWNNDKEIEWIDILAYIQKYLNNPLFGSAHLERKKSDSIHDYKLVLGAIAQLISSGSNMDNHAFEGSLTVIAQKIVFRCINWVTASEEFEATNMDYPTYFLNSTNGKIIDSLIILSLRIARLKNYNIDSSEIKWNEETRVVFEKLLKSKVLEAYIAMGFFFRNLMYLDSKWTIDKIKENQDQEINLLWRAIIESYVFNRTIIGEVKIYELFKPYYRRYILSEDDKRRFSGIVDHCTSYFLLYCENKTEGNLIKEIISSKKTHLIHLVIDEICWKWKNGLFSVQSKSEIVEDNIIEFWIEIITIFRDDDNIESKKCISYSNRFLSIFCVIDDRILPLIMEACEYLQYGYDTSYIVEELQRLKDHGETIVMAEHILEIYLKILQVVTPDYNPKFIQNTIDYIFKIKDNHLKEKCNEVCNIYATRGYFLLREIYSKHNSV
ncbi:MAG: hypothetical protein JXB49_36855 [Bacteroidales bacterium]|nr:hypothetical protein [Bacteroidales bacterium]